MQLDLPFIKPTDARPEEVAVWIVACPDADAVQLASLLSRRKHLFVDSRTAESLIDPSDFILLKMGLHGSYKLFGPKAVEHVDVERLVGSNVEPWRGNERVQNLVGIFLGEQPVTDGVLPADGVGMERLLAILRHAELEGVPLARLRRAIEIRGIVEETASPPLLAILDREAADASRELHKSRLEFDADAPGTALLHRRASGMFRASGMVGHSARVRDLLDRWLSSEQLRFSFTDEAYEADSQPNDRIAYHVSRVVAHRLSVPGMTKSPYVSPYLALRRNYGIFDLPDALVCQWLQGLRSSRLKPWHRWREGEDAHLLEACLDIDLAVLTQTTGFLGLKSEKYTLRAWGGTCRVEPAVSRYAVGEIANLRVYSDVCDVEQSPTILNLNFTTQSGASTTIALNVPA
jgi:hypothetical protein